MFTGIITAVGQVADIETGPEQRQFTIQAGAEFLSDSGIGESIAVDGVCLTVTSLDGGAFTADVSNETADLTTLGDRATGAWINLERPLAVGDSLGGHLVAGHVDGLGRIVSWSTDDASWRLVVAGDPSLARYWASKGSVCIDGISLTINEVGDDWFGINIVPHTLEETALGQRQVGEAVNLEADLIARYVARQLADRV